MNRIFHTYEKWECYPAGFYETRAPRGIDAATATRMYADFLRDIPRFKVALSRVISEWKNSCEHYLSNENMNRIAWLGQASACIDMGLPACFRGGFRLLTETEQREANQAALEALNEWLSRRGEPGLNLDSAKSKTEVELY